VLRDMTLAPVDDASKVTIFAQCYHSIPTPDEANSLELKWQRLREIRAEVLKSLEVLRADGKIGASLQAEVDIGASGDDLALLDSLGDQLKFLFIVSRAHTHASNDGLQIQVTASTHQKCARCWHYTADVGSNAEHPEICQRCVDNLAEAEGG